MCYLYDGYQLHRKVGYFSLHSCVSQPTVTAVWLEPWSRLLATIFSMKPAFNSGWKLSLNAPLAEVPTPLEQ